MTNRKEISLTFLFIPCLGLKTFVLRVFYDFVALLTGCLGVVCMFSKIKKMLVVSSLHCHLAREERIRQSRGNLLEDINGRLQLLVTFKRLQIE